MKKKIVLSLVLLGSLNNLNADTLQDMFSNGKVSGNIREFSISRSVDDTRSAKSNYTRNANSIGGFLKYETADYKGFSFGTAFHTTNGFLLDNPKDDYRKVDPTLFGKDNTNYSMLGEAYLKYAYANTTFTAGRQKLNTPLAGADDARMIPNFFEAYVLTNKDIDDTTILLAHVTKFAQGTFGRAYNGGILAVTGGYSAVDTRNQVGDFVNMGTYALGDGKDTSGVTVASATYTGIEGLKVQLWDYYAYDILNAVYGEVSYKMNFGSIKPFIASQIISESDVGNKYAGDLNGFYWGAKVGAKVDAFTAYVAYSSTSSNDDNDDSTKNAIISPWGGMPAYTQGMVTRHIFLAGTQAIKIAASYNFKSMGINLKTVLYHSNYNMDKNNGYTDGDATETGFDFIYYPEDVKNLQLRFRGNFSRDFYVNNTNIDTSLNGTVSWNEYRFIMNYSF